MINFVGIGSGFSPLQSVVANAGQASGIGYGIGVGAAGLVVGLLGIFSIYLSFRMRRTGSNLRKNGMTVIGAIAERGTGITASASSRTMGSRYYRVSYRYDVQGKTYSHKQTVSKTDYEALTEGTPVSVRCLAQDPTVARVINPRTGRVLPDTGTSEGMTVPLTFGCLGVAFLGMAIWLVGTGLIAIINR